MKSLDSTQLLPAPSWADPRVHLLDDLWLLTIFAILLAAGLPWLVSSFEMQLGAALLGLLALTAVHVAFTVLVGPTGLDAGRRRALSLLHAVGVAAIGAVWHYAGGLQNPAFLIVFVLPVVGAIFLSRWQPYVAALAAVLMVTVVALAEAPELRWYASGLAPIGPWIVAHLGRRATGADTPFPGFYAPAGYYLVLLEGFAVLMLACAFAAEYLGAIFERLHAHVAAARLDAEHGRELWSSLIEELPQPAALVEAATMRIVAESAALAAGGWTRAPSLGRRLHEVVQFSYPEVVEELVNGAGGIAPEVTLRAGGGLRMARVHVRHVAYRGRRFALVAMEDRTETFAVRAALDCAEQATLVLDADDRVLAFNKPALALFSTVRVGADAATL
ncbi:MAG: hypothetical protein ACREUG_11360, partial [Steroidobacteraceae bacterium]